MKIAAIIVMGAHAPFAVIAAATHFGPLIGWILAGVCLLVCLSYFAALLVARWMRVMGAVNASLVTKPKQ